MEENFCIIVDFSKQICDSIDLTNYFLLNILNHKILSSAFILSICYGFISILVSIQMFETKL